MYMQQLFASPVEVKPEIVTKKDVAYQALEKSRLDDRPYVEAQEELEMLFDKNQRNRRIMREFNIKEFWDLHAAADMPPEVTRDFCLSLCLQMVIHKRTSASTLIGTLYRHFDTGTSRTVAMQACADALEQAIKHDFVDYSIEREEFIVRLQLTAEAQKELDRFQYPLPMVVQPKSLKSNRHNGYLSDETSKSLVVLKAGRATEFYEQADLCLDHLDRMNKIRLTLNMSVVELIDNEWADLDKKRPGEPDEDYRKRVRAFERYDESSKDVIHAISQLRDVFWLTHKYDRRGRVYCQGYHVNYQGNPWNKAVVEFADKELIEP